MGSEMCIRDRLNSMTYYDAGVSINCNNNVDFKSIVNNALNIPLTVRPNDVEINTTSNPACVIKARRVERAGRYV